MSLQAEAKKIVDSKGWTYLEAQMTADLTLAMLGVRATDVDGLVEAKRRIEVFEWICSGLRELADETR